mmetsp:Transcript_110442/g.356239  ORF Transcript_110442/g.356239 Transcript_110442/m.356239 type:complete len:155 (+) Transcript_110442:172-636(+)
MSVLAAAARGARAAAAPRALPALRIAKRGLGETTVGPDQFDFVQNWSLCKKFVAGDGAISYREFHTMCKAVRLYAFIAVNTGCVLALIMNPPKSSYWSFCQPWTPIRGFFFGSAKPLFLTEKVEHATDAVGVVEQFVTLRRLEGAGSDSEEEDH